MNLGNFTVKHGLAMQIYQYIVDEDKSVNVSLPEAAQYRKKIEEMMLKYGLPEPLVNHQEKLENLEQLSMLMEKFAEMAPIFDAMYKGGGSGMTKAALSVIPPQLRSIIEGKMSESARMSESKGT